MRSNTPMPPEMARFLTQSRGERYLVPGLYMGQAAQRTLAWCITPAQPTGTPPPCPASLHRHPPSLMPACAVNVACELPDGTEAELNTGLAALPAGQVVSVQETYRHEYWAAPAVLAALTALTQLRLTARTQLNSSSAWETTLQPLAQLRELSLFNCQLTAVPAALSRCTLLTNLDLVCNPLTSGWQHLQLRRLYLGNAGDVAAGSCHLTTLSQLRYLDLGDCALSEVPAAVSALTTLTDLLLDHNALRRGFDHLRPLAQLRWLSLTHNNLVAIPPAIAALTALRHLYVGLRVRSGWQHLQPLAHLELSDVAVYMSCSAGVALQVLRNLHPAAARHFVLNRYHKLLPLAEDPAFPANLTIQDMRLLQ